MSKEITSSVFISLSQGSVFNGIPCGKEFGFGIIITAACDLANGKAQVVHYIVAKTLKSFFCNNLCDDIALERIKNICTNNKIDYNSIIYNIKYIESCLHEVKVKDRSLLKELHSLYFSECIDDCKLKSNLESQFKKKHDEIFEYKKGNIHYIRNFGDHFNDGYVVDFCDIRSIPVDLAKKIESGIEFFWNDKDCIKYLLHNEKCYISSAEKILADQILSYVYKLKSPELEHLMQRFSYNFIRIGAEDIESHEKESIYKQFGKKQP